MILSFLKKEISSSSHPTLDTHLSSISYLQPSSFSLFLPIISKKLSSTSVSTDSSPAHPSLVILTSANKHYHAILLNWMLYMRINSIFNYIILCFDQETYQLVGDIRHEDGYGILINDCLTRNHMYKIRHYIANILLNNNYTVVISDCDCIWLHDFRYNWIEQFSSSPYQVDIITQIGRYPDHIFKKYGYTVCAGFMVLFPTNNTRLFYQDLLYTFMTRSESMNTSEYDDQYQINSLLDELQLIPKFSSSIYSIPSILEIQNFYRNKSSSSNSILRASQITPFIHHLNTTTTTFHNPIQLAFYPSNYFPRISSISSVSRLNIHSYYQYYSLQYCPLIWHLKPPSQHPSTYLYHLKKSNLFLLDSRWHEITRKDIRESYFEELISKYLPTIPRGPCFYQ